VHRQTRLGGRRTSEASRNLYRDAPSDYEVETSLNMLAGFARTPDEQLSQRELVPTPEPGQCRPARWPHRQSSHGSLSMHSSVYPDGWERPGAPIRYPNGRPELVRLNSRIARTRRFFGLSRQSAIGRLDWRRRQDLSLGQRTLRQVGSSFSSLVRFGSMSQPLTADDLLPLIAKLSSAERGRLFRLIQKVGNDVEAYRAVPPTQDEFSSEEDMLAWDGDGWEDVR